jgi:hypothetical protein
MLARGFIVTECAMLDQLMDVFVTKFFLGEDFFTEDPSRQLPEVKDGLNKEARLLRASIFDTYVLQRLYLLDKFKIFAEMAQPPRYVTAFVHTTNDLRNAIAHTFIIEKRKSPPKYRRLVGLVPEQPAARQRELRGDDQCVEGSHRACRT